MLGVGWTEMLIVGVVALIVIGPKELPALMHRIGKFAGTIRRMGADFQRELNKTTGLDEVRNLRSAITQPLKATTDAIRKEFNTTTSTGAVQPSGALKPADPKVESVVSEIHKAAGMAPQAAQTPKEAMHDAMKQAMLNQSAINKEAAAKAATAAPVKAAAKKVATTVKAAPLAAKKRPAPKATPKKLTAKKVESPAPIEAIAPAKKPAAKLAVKPMPKAPVKAAAAPAAKPAAKAKVAAPATKPVAKAAKPAAKRKPAAKKA